MSEVCHRCKCYLPNTWTIKSNGEMPDNAWRMKNIAPHAEGGGMMMPVCHKCDPGPLAGWWGGASASTECATTGIVEDRQ